VKAYKIQTPPVQSFLFCLRSSFAVLTLRYDDKAIAAVKLAKAADRRYSPCKYV